MANGYMKDSGQRGFGQQYNIPDLPFSTPGNMDRFLPSSRRGRPQGPAGDRQIPPELLQLLMTALMGGGMDPGLRDRLVQPRINFGPQPRPPMGGGRPPRGGPQRGGQRPPMGGGRPPVIKIEDLVRAISGRGGGRRPPQQADMAVPQAPR